MATSTASLAAWYTSLDKEMKTSLEAFTEEDLQTKSIARGNWMVTIDLNHNIYLQAIDIFCGKAWIHLHALNKELPEQWVDWIG